MGLDSTAAIAPFVGSYGTASAVPFDVISHQPYLGVSLTKAFQLSPEAESLSLLAYLLPLLQE